MLEKKNTAGFAQSEHRSSSFFLTGATISPSIQASDVNRTIKIRKATAKHQHNSRNRTGPRLFFPASHDTPIATSHHRLMNKPPTNKQRMLAGELYDASDPELAEDRTRAKLLTHRFNASLPTDTTLLQNLLRALLGSIGPRSVIMQPFQCDYGYNIHLGDQVFINHNCIMLDCAPITIGDGVLIGPNCGLYTAGHPLDIARRLAWLEYAHPISIGDKVWLGGGVQVMPGVSIGEGSVIGGGSVVVKDIPAGVVAAGNPCRVLRAITPEDALRQHRYGKPTG